MFENRHRGYKLAAALFVLFALCIYSEFSGLANQKHLSSIRQTCITYITSCHNQLLFLPSRLLSTTKDSFTILTLTKKGPKWADLAEYDHPIIVRGQLVGIQPGDEFALLARFDRSGVIEMIKYEKEPSRIRILKYLVSILGLILTIILLFNRYRLSKLRILPLHRR